MNKPPITAAMAMLFVAPAFAAGDHDGGHGHKNMPAQMHGHGAMAIGMPGTAAKVSRTIDVVMTETDDGAMIFKPDMVELAKGETVKFALYNSGEIDHEFVIGDRHEIMKHKKVMESAEAEHQHHHDNPNAARLAPGKRGEIIWAFTNGGAFEFACLLPGHYEAGMKGTLKVGTN